MIDIVLRAAGFVLVDAIRDAQLHGEWGQLLLGAGHADKVRVKIVDVLFELPGCIALRVNRHEQNLEIGYGIVVQLIELLVDQLQVVQRAGADIGAMGVAEKDQRPVSTQIIQRKRRSRIVDQGEIGYHPWFGKHHQRCVGWLRRALHDLPQRDACHGAEESDEHCQHDQPEITLFRIQFCHGAIILRDMIIAEYIEKIARQLDAADLCFGHGTDNATDEAAWLVLHVAGAPLDGSFDDWDRIVNETELLEASRLARSRCESRLPLAYLLGVARFAGLEFEVDENVLVPRSPLAELILVQYMPWLEPGRVGRVLDMCTGSGCIAIASALNLPGAQVDAADISAKALEVARRNVERYRLNDRVTLIESDLFQSIPERLYDLIVANPPYVPAPALGDLPAEYRAEPGLGLASGSDGLDAVLSILLDAPDFLGEDGVLVCEVGESEPRLAAALPGIPFLWLEFEHGGSGVFVLTKGQLEEARTDLAALIGERLI
jgi:ribosomal protein L3 glutamine methyltransferase